MVRVYYITRRVWKDGATPLWSEPHSGSFTHQTIETLECDDEMEAVERALVLARELEERLFVSSQFAPLDSVFPDGSVAHYATGRKQGWWRGPFTEGLPF